MRASLRALVLSSLVSVTMLAGGCAARHGAVDSNVRVDPHHGREWEDGMTALGAVVAPHSPLPRAEVAERQRALSGYGTLIDLLAPAGR